MIEERRAGLVLVGNRGEEFHLTISDPNGQHMASWVMDVAQFDAMMMRAHQASISYRVVRLREAAAAELDRRQAESFIGQMGE